MTMNIKPRNPQSAAPQLSSAQAFLLDGDGVLYRGKQPLPGAREFISALNASGTPFLLLTNNATQTPQQIAARLEAIDIDIGPEQVLTSAQATASWLEHQYPDRGHVLAVGMAGLHTALLEAGFQIVTDHRHAEVVVAALDRDLSYAKLAEATMAIWSGCPFIGTNPDKSFPSERGIEPGAGAILALLEAASGVSPTIIGKPQPGIFHQALTQLDVEPTLAVMVGDRYETDILGGHAAGLSTAGVLTGITGAAEFAQANPAPTWVFQDLGELLEAWRPS